MSDMSYLLSPVVNALSNLLNGRTQVVIVRDEDGRVSAVRVKTSS